MSNCVSSRRLPIAFLGVLVGALVATSVAPVRAQRVRRLQDVLVKFEFRDMRKDRFYDKAELAAINDGGRDLLIRALQSRFPHLHFAKDVNSKFVLECAIDKGGSFDQKPHQDSKADAVFWHFRLTDCEPECRWQFRSIGEHGHAFLPKDALLSELEVFLGLAERDPADTRGAPAWKPVETRFATLFERLCTIPLFESHGKEHVKGTKLFVIKALRHDYHCAIPDLTEFRIQATLDERIVGPQLRKFRVQLLDALEAGRIPSEHQELLATLLTKALPQGDSKTFFDDPEKLMSAVAKSIEERVFLHSLGPIADACLETKPDDFEPGGQ